MKKSKELKIQNRFLVIKQKKINKTSNPLRVPLFSQETKGISFTRRKSVYSFRRYEELKYTHTHTHKRTHARTDTHIQENKNHQNQIIYTYIAIQHLFEHFFYETFFTVTKLPL